MEPKRNTKKPKQNETKHYKVSGFYPRIYEHDEGKINAFTKDVWKKKWALDSSQIIVNKKYSAHTWSNHTTKNDSGKY